MDKITQMLENVVRCKYFEAGVHIKNPIKNSYQDGLGRMIQTLDHVVVVRILLWKKKKSQINEYSDTCRIMNPKPTIVNDPCNIQERVKSTEIYTCRRQQWGMKKTTKNPWK